MPKPTGLLPSSKRYRRIYCLVPLALKRCSATGRPFTTYSRRHSWSFVSECRWSYIRSCRSYRQLLHWQAAAGCHRWIRPAAPHCTICRCWENEIYPIGSGKCCKGSPWVSISRILSRLFATISEYSLTV